MNQGGRTRRQVLQASISAAAGLVLGAPVRRVLAAPYGDVRFQPDPTSAQTTPGAADTQRLADDLFVVRMPGEANVIAHIGSDGVVLVDGASAAASDALLSVVARLPGAGPV